MKRIHFERKNSGFILISLVLTISFVVTLLISNISKYLSPLHLVISDRNEREQGVFGAVSCKEIYLRNIQSNFEYNTILESGDQYFKNKDLVCLFDHYEESGGVFKIYIKTEYVTHKNETKSTDVVLLIKKELFRISEIQTFIFNL